MLLRLTCFLMALHISLEHDLHEGHALIAPKLLVWLLGLRGLTCYCLEGLTIAVIATEVQGVVGLLGTAIGHAMLAKLLTATLLRDLTSQTPRHPALRVALGFGPGCTSLTLCLELLVVLLNNDLLNSPNAVILGNPYAKKSPLPHIGVTDLLSACLPKYSPPPNTWPVLLTQ